MSAICAAGPVSSVGSASWIQSVLSAYPATGYWDERNAAKYTVTGSGFASWSDELGTYAPLLQASDASRPPLSANLFGTGKPGLGADNVQTYMLGAGALASLIDDTAPYTAFIKVRTKASGSSGLGVISAGAVAATTSCIELIGCASNVARHSRESAGAVANATTLAMAAATDYVLAIAYNGTTQARVWVNGVAAAENPMANTKAVPGLDLMSIGARWRNGVASGFLGFYATPVVIPALAPDQLITDHYSWYTGRF